nr:Toll/interleukin-1 receptor (TIR) domain-containing protein [Tanacetum cinerariifolium]
MSSNNRLLHLSGSSSVTPGASTSTSSFQNRFMYDVFISFRGEDTRKTFVDHLYHALMDKGIYTYRDDENIQKGKRINDDLFKSIEYSKFYIIVFSKNYASSSWCLKELVKIMECQKMHGHTAYLVFYDVEPTEVRNQSGDVGEAFAKHKKEESFGKWREALKEVADLAGWELKNTLDGMPPKCNSASTTSASDVPAMNQAAIRQLVVDSVVAALEAQAANMANADNTNRNHEPREAHVARKCGYKSS